MSKKIRRTRIRKFSDTWICVDNDGKFTCTFRGEEFKENSLEVILNKLEEASRELINEPCYIKTYDGIRKGIIATKWNDGYNNTVFNIKDENGHRSHEDGKNIFPITSHNTKLYNECQKLRAEGWNIIHQGEAKNRLLRRENDVAKN